jgi:uncharacterized LabA/DUF88 family protein
LFPAQLSAQDARISHHLGRLETRIVENDAAYLLSADGDLTPAVQEVRSLHKKVFIASAASGAQLAAVANAFIRVDASWLADCWML